MLPEVDWRKRARCAGLAFYDRALSDRMFFSGAKPTKQTTEFCYGCVVREQCFAVGSSASHGVWGGVAAHNIPRGLVELRSTRTVGVPVPWSRDRIKMVRRRLRAGETRAELCAELCITPAELHRVTEGMMSGHGQVRKRRRGKAGGRPPVDGGELAA
jgi:hypothetical protein